MNQIAIANLRRLSFFKGCKYVSQPYFILGVKQVCLFPPSETLLSSSSPVCTSHFSNNRKSLETGIEELAVALFYCIRTSMGLSSASLMFVPHSVFLTDKATYWTCEGGIISPLSLLTAPFTFICKVDCKVTRLSCSRCPCYRITSGLW